VNFFGEIDDITYTATLKYCVRLASEKMPSVYSERRGGDLSLAGDRRQSACRVVGRCTNYVRVISPSVLCHHQIVLWSTQTLSCTSELFLL